MKLIGGGVRTARRGGRCRQDGAELAVLQQILLQLGQYVLAVRELAQRVYVRSDLVHERLALCRLGHVDHLLHHVVGILVLHHRVQRTVWSIQTSSDKLTYENKTKKRNEKKD